MPSSSTISSSDKSKVKSAILSSSNKIITATVGRVYATSPNPSKWDFVGIEGAVAFVCDLSKSTFYFKVVDLKGTRGVIWQHELYDGFVYNQDRTFFHSFEGDDCMVGFSFADEGEASDLFKRVSNRSKYAKSKAAAISSGQKKKGAAGKIDKSTIGAPSGFKHVAHMGFTAEHGFSSQNVDPSWQALLDQLGSMGVSENDIRKNENFIKDFVGKRGGPGAAAKPASPPSQPKAKKVPPPAPTSKRKAPPPPPAPRRAGNASTASSTSTAPPPPPPPARGGAASAAPPPPPPPPPPARGGASGGAPPPPPARPAAGGAPPPPPPPPPPMGGSSSGAPPPPPPPPVGGSAAPPPPPAPPPPAQGGRGDLLASIQGKGIHSLKKSDGPGSAHTAAMAGGAAAGGLAIGAGAGAGAVAADTDAGGGGDGDLASALAAALTQRKENMGDSDEDESDDDW